MKVVAAILGASISLLILAVASFFYGMMALSVSKPLIMVPCTLAAYGAILALCAFGVKKGFQSPFLGGLLVGGIIGSLLCGLCSTMAATNTSGLNFH